MIYLDNAATTFPKPRCVIEATKECIKQYCGNPGRSAHRLSIKTSEKIFEARERISNFLGISNPENVVFTQNATHALNLAIKTTVKPNSHILISDIEHNSVLRPVHALKNKIGVEYSVFESKGNLEKNISSKITPDTKYIVSSLASNVIGREISIKELSEISKKYGLCLITDASQLIGHKKIDLRSTPCDVLCAPAHKALFGIQGAGFCVFMDKLERDTIFEGGSGNDSKNLLMPEFLPERFEAGTLSSPAIISLLAGIEFINEVGIDAIEEKIFFLTEKYAEVINSINNAILYEYGNGVISFNISNTPAENISKELDRFGICTRSGLHCSPLAHKTMGTLNIGTVRISLSYLNTKKEIDEFYKKLKEIAKSYSSTRK